MWTTGGQERTKNDRERNCVANVSISHSFTCGISSSYKKGCKVTISCGALQGIVKKLKTAIPRLGPTFPELLVSGNSKNGTTTMSDTIVRKIVKKTA